MDDIASDSVVHFISADSTEFYEYVVVPDDNVETYYIGNQANYIPYLFCIIFALGIIAGLFWGWVSSWKH